MYINVDIAKHMGINSNIRVYLNDREVKDCLAALTGKDGYIVQYVKNSDGSYAIENDEIRTARIAGNVRIELE